MHLWVGPHNARSLCLLHTGMCRSTQICQKFKDYSVKEYNRVGYINIKISYMSLWIVNEATYLLAHETCSVCAP